MILLANGRLITRDPDGVGYFADGGVVTDGGTIVEVGTTADLKAKYPQAEPSKRCPREFCVRLRRLPTRRRTKLWHCLTAPTSNWMF